MSPLGRETPTTNVEQDGEMKMSDSTQPGLYCTVTYGGSKGARSPKFIKEAATGGAGVHDSSSWYQLFLLQMPGGLHRGRLPAEATPGRSLLPRRQQRLETAAPGPGPDGGSPRTPLFPSVETDVCLWQLARLASSSHMRAGTGCGAGGSHFDFLSFRFLLHKLD